ncbi:MAG: hypothetical protein HYX68_17400 [Planctomycetes bacterium]|nr:hypothetical protein [Planctomycetota bacterium]
MSNTIPCPNPVCVHQFSQAELQAATQIACPKCGFRMQGRGPAPVAAAKPVVKPKPKPPPAASKKPASAPPLATPITTAPPVAASPPLAVPIAKSDAGSAQADGPNPTAFMAGGAGPLVRTGQFTRKTNWTRVLVTFFSVGLAACVVIAGISFLVLYFVGPGGGGAGIKGDEHTGILRGSKNESEKVYKLILPRTEWTSDENLRVGLNAHAAFKHNEYPFWFAIAVKDYGMHKPRNAELFRHAVDNLESHFGDTLELEKNAEPTKFGDLPALSLPFRGKLMGDFWPGYCLMFFNNGIAYWFMMASSDDSTLESFAETLPKDNVFVLSERKNWVAQPWPTEVFVAQTGKFDLTTLKGVWEKYPPKDVDDNGVLLLAGTYKTHRGQKDNLKNAQLLVFTQGKKPDLKTAMKAIQAYVTTREGNVNQTNKILPATEVTPKQPELGEVTNIGNRPGRILDLKLTSPDQTKPMRYYLLGAVNEPDVCYGILCECNWDARQIWRQDFLDLIASFRVRKSED